MFRIIKKPELSPGRAVLSQILAILVSLCAAAIIVLILGYNPIEFYANLVKGALGSAYRVRATFNKAIPLVILSLGTLIAFKMKFWNIGAEGQMCMGAFGAAYFALNFSHLPAYVLLPLMALAGLVCGGIWALIPALLKVKFGTSETLVTLMLNYVALRWITYLQYGPWREVGGMPKIATFEANAVLPSVFGIHIGWIIALVLTVFVYILMTRTKFGYEISVLGESQATARYAGINVNKTIVIAILLSGALCGLAGMVQSSAVEKTLTEQFTGGLGFTAVITTYLARLSAPAIIVTSFLFAILLAGGSFLETSMRIPISMIYAMQAVIIFFVLGSEFFLNYKIVPRAGKGGAK
ncbi:MAG: ABC transporter permease [Oscillospiraceae bacterium]|nr:ABC transporter permease [Oscillospiraceae bacterium]